MNLIQDFLMKSNLRWFLILKFHLLTYILEINFNFYQ